MGLTPCSASSGRWGGRTRCRGEIEIAAPRLPLAGGVGASSSEMRPRQRTAPERLVGLAQRSRAALPISRWNRIIRWSVSLAHLLLASACSNLPCDQRAFSSRPSTTDLVTPFNRSRSHGSSDLATSKTDVIVQAMHLIGTPYRWGGNTPESGFDCSGFVRYVMKAGANVHLPRTAAEMSREGVPMRQSDMAPGDLVFFNTDGRPHSHVGIYLGGFRFVSAPSKGGVVRIDQIRNEYWATRIDAVRRIVTTNEPDDAIAREVPTPLPSSSASSRSWRESSVVPYGRADPIAEALARNDAWIAENVGR
ncbi:UNVERIFIED_ORG: cell wall-associated NlpC family hydrolase [Burkholderia sp. 1263]